MTNTENTTSPLTLNVAAGPEQIAEDLVEGMTEWQAGQVLLALVATLSRKCIATEQDDAAHLLHACLDPVADAVAQL